MTQISLYCSVGKELHKLDGLWTSVTWSGETTAAPRRLEFTMNNTSNGKTRIIKPANGALVRMKRTRDGVELFRGYLFKKSINADGSASYLAYDPLIYLTKSKTSATFKAKKASDIVAIIAKKFGISVGSIADTKVKLDKMIFRDKSPYEIITVALTETRRAGGSRFILSASKGKLTLKKIETGKFKYKVTSSTNMQSAEYSESIEERKTQVMLTGGDATRFTNKAVVKSNDAIKKYGVMQYYANKTTKDKAKLKKLADELLKRVNSSDSEFTVNVIGNIGFKAGRRIYVDEPMSSRKGLFYITSDSHNFNADGTHTAELSLSRKIELPSESYEAPSEPATKQYISKSGKYAAVDYQTGWKATCYAYQLGGINGSKAGITASGTKVKEGRTIAVDPRVIPLGSIVAVYSSTKPKYSGLYLAEDTGGAIKGKHIDIAVTPSNIKDFGTRTLSVAIIKRGTGAADARAKAANWSKEVSKINAAQKAKVNASITKVSNSSQVSKVVTFARSFKGKLAYVLGGKNIGSGRGDCSGFSYHCYKAIGVNIGQGTINQVKKGTPVSRNNARAGDLVFFQGTYRPGVSHVGIVTRPGYCVSLNGSGCTEHSYTSGYWGSHYMTIRRVL